MFCDVFNCIFHNFWKHMFKMDGHFKKNKTKQNKKCISKNKTKKNNNNNNILE